MQTSEQPNDGTQSYLHTINPRILNITIAVTKNTPVPSCLKLLIDSPLNTMAVLFAAAKKVAGVLPTAVVKGDGVPSDDEDKFMFWSR